jgi:hypothetical protein
MEQTATQRGPGVFLVQTEPNKSRVLDATHRAYFKAFNIHSADRRTTASVPLIVVRFYIPLQMFGLD